MYVKDDLGYKKRLKKRPSRPPFLTFLCIVFALLGFSAIVLSFVHIYSNSISSFYPAFNSLMIVFAFVAISGIWSMEKWGPVSFSIVTVLKLLTDLIFIGFSWNTLWSLFMTSFAILWVPFALLFFIYFPKMRRGS